MGKPRTEWDGMTQQEYLKKMAPYVVSYCNWYAENGIFLPEEYERDPASWTQVIRFIQAVFEMIDNDDEEEEEMGIGYTEADQELYKKGIEYFYQYNRYLWR